MPSHRTIKGIPLGCEGTAEEVAHAVVFLASPAASFVNGEISGINAGMWWCWYESYDCELQGLWRWWDD